jgi:hypothetical protein
VHRFMTGASVAVLLIATCAIPAMAAGPSHETIRGTDVETDFCGTGQTVNLTVKGAFNVWEDKATGHVKTTWTNPANGIAVYDSFSGGGTISFIDDGDGAYTIAITRVGQPLRLQYVGGPVIIRDAGKVIVHDHFDADDKYLGTDVVVVKGPHPGLELDWCELMVEVLEL